MPAEVARTEAKSVGAGDVVRGLGRRAFSLRAMLAGELRRPSPPVQDVAGIPLRRDWQSASRLGPVCIRQH